MPFLDPPFAFCLLSVVYLLIQPLTSLLFQHYCHPPFIDEQFIAPDIQYVCEQYHRLIVPDFYSRHTSSSLAILSRTLFATASDSFLDKFLKNTISLAPSERADALNVNDDIEVEHQAVAEQGDSRVRSLVAGFFSLF